MNRYILLLFLVVIVACKQEKQPKKSIPMAEGVVPTYTELHRPQYHFTPPQNWMNDPNGLVYYEGEYHLFYQYNPFGDKWGHMSWGHAVSEDLVHWEHLPIALQEFPNLDEGDSTMIFSGCAVADINNTSGLFEEGESGLVAIYTGHIHEGGEVIVQYQNVAFSTDNGRTWTQYEGNPVIDLNLTDFRDPKVFWHEPTEKWIMSIALPDKYKVQFYASENLLNWELMSTFGEIGDQSKFWECPDLVELEVEGTEEKKWVLIVSAGSQYEDYWGMQYFVGDFDGEQFVPETTYEEPTFIDYGRDFYAAVTWNGNPDDRVILQGWMNSWKYGNDIPTSPWKGIMATPRTLQLRQVGTTYQLIQEPIDELKQLRGKHYHFEDLLVGDKDSLLEGITGKSFDIELKIEASNFYFGGLYLFKGDSTQLEVTFEQKDSALSINRTNIGNLSFHEGFATYDSKFTDVWYDIEDGMEVMTIRILMDQSTVEVFGQNGGVTISDLVFPDETEIGLQLFSYGDDKMKVKSLDIWEMNSIW